MNRRSLIFLFIAVVVGSSCRGEGPATSDQPAPSIRESTTTQPSLPGTSVGPTTTEFGVTTTTTSPTSRSVRFTIEKHGLHPGSLPGSDGWLGSGCSPGSDQLPDGIWWGYNKGLSPTSITFDLACLDWIPDPNDDAIEEGGWVVENNNPKLRVVPVHSEAQVTCLLWGCPPDAHPYLEWIEAGHVHYGEGGADGLWLYVNDGVVTEVGHEGLAG